MDYAQRVAEARRLQILGLLEKTPGYETGQELLYQALTIHSSSAQVADDILYLKSIGLVTSRVVEGMQMARITQRGIDVWKGLAVAAGVQRPGPGA